MRRRIALTMLAVALLGSAYLPALEAAPEAPPRPVDLYISTTQPMKLVETADALFAAILKNTPREQEFPPNLIRNLAANMEIASLFGNPDARLAALVALDPRAEPEFAIVLDGVNPRSLSADLKRLGFELSTEGQTLVAGADVYSPGLTLYLSPVDGGRILVSPSMEINTKFSEAAENWRPEHPADGDVRVLLNVDRLRQMFPDEVAQFRGILASDIGEMITADMPDIFDGETRANIATACTRLVRMFGGLPLEIDVAELSLTVDGDLLDIVCAITPSSGSAFSHLAESYDGAPVPEFKMARAIRKDAYLYSAFPRTGGTLFEEGDLLGGIGMVVADSMLPESVREIAKLATDYAANPVSEEVCGYYTRDNGLMRVAYGRVRSGKEYVQLLSRSIALASQALDKSVSDEKVRVSIETETGKAGPANYTRAFLKPEFVSGAKDEDFSDVEAYSLYMASNRDTILTITGPNIQPDAIPGEISRLGADAKDALVDEPIVADVLAKLDGSRLGHALFKPTTLFRSILEIAVQSDDFKQKLTGDMRPEDVLDSLPDSGTFAGYGFDAAAGALSVRIVIPLPALNDFVVIGIKWNTIGSIEITEDDWDD